jgi:hypothetical protein
MVQTTNKPAYLPIKQKYRITPMKVISRERSNSKHSFETGFTKPSLLEEIENVSLKKTPPIQSRNYKDSKQNGFLDELTMILKSRKTKPPPDFSEVEKKKTYVNPRNKEIIHIKQNLRKTQKNKSYSKSKEKSKSSDKKSSSKSKEKSKSSDKKSSSKSKQKSKSSDKNKTLRLQNARLNPQISNSMIKKKTTNKTSYLDNFKKNR